MMIASLCRSVGPRHPGLRGRTVLLRIGVETVYGEIEAVSRRVVRVACESAIGRGARFATLALVGGGRLERSLRLSGEVLGVDPSRGDEPRVTLRLDRMYANVGPDALSSVVARLYPDGCVEVRDPEAHATGAVCALATPDTGKVRVRPARRPQPETSTARMDRVGQALTPLAASASVIADGEATPAVIYRASADARHLFVCAARCPLRVGAPATLLLSVPASGGSRLLRLHVVVEGSGHPDPASCTSVAMLRLAPGHDDEVLPAWKLAFDRATTAWATRRRARRSAPRVRATPTPTIRLHVEHLLRAA